MLLYKVMVANNNISNTFSPFAGVTLAIVGAFLLITFSTKVLCLKAVKVNLRKQCSYSDCWWLNQWNHVGLVMLEVCFRSHAVLVNIVSVIPFAFLWNLNHVFEITYWKFSVKLQQGSHSHEKSLNFRGSPWIPFYPWKVIKFFSFFNFEWSGMKSVF